MLYTLGENSGLAGWQMLSRIRKSYLPTDEEELLLASIAASMVFNFVHLGGAEKYSACIRATRVKDADFRGTNIHF
jgi:hypothetical protein